MLTVDLETQTPTGKPDFRVDEVERVGWLEEGAETAKWAGCFCPMPYPDIFLMHNAMYDLGIVVRYPWFDAIRGHTIFEVHDTLALAYALGEQDLSLKGLGQKYLGVQTVTHSQQEKIGTEQYHAQDLWLTQRLWAKLRGMERGTAYDIDRALIPALIDCSYRGYEIDQERLEKATLAAEETVGRAGAAFDRLMVDVEVLLSRRKKVTKSRGLEYVEKFGSPGINSPIQLQRYFGVDSTNKETMNEIAQRDGDQALAAALIGQWRKSDKLLDTYFYPNRGKEKLTGLFNITPSETGEGGTGTGRLSSERSNMQNLTPALERCLRAPEGFLLMRGDYPQIELRCAAEISGDETLLSIFKSRRDPHQEAADRLFGGDRKRAKTFNFRELYIAGEEVRKVYPGFYGWAWDHWRRVQKVGYSVAPKTFLHRRPIPLLSGVR